MMLMIPNWKISSISNFAHDDPEQIGQKSDEEENCFRLKCRIGRVIKIATCLETF